MRLITGVDLPTELVSAQADGRLVVFAGAGVAHDPPSGLPTFDALAQEVVAGAVEREHDDTDRYLARAKAVGVDVHELVRSRIDAPASTPNELHRLIVGLFGAMDRIRLVTTNYERHFFTVSEQLPGKGVEVFAAPALPRGNHFAGIVHLHGWVAREASRLVLTSDDFGRAYLTEGWATRFLSELFVANTVLFVGYSHQDTVVDYLARGLPPRTSRFAFVPEDDEDQIRHWRELGVTPIVYPMTLGADSHAALRLSLEDLGRRTRMGTLEHEARIRELASQDPPLDPESDDYMSMVVSDLLKVKLFTRHASSTGWLEWAESKGILNALFSQTFPLDPISDALANWFSGRYVCCYPDHALDLLIRHKQVLNPALWTSIAIDLSRPSERSESAVAKWVPVLVAAEPRPSPGRVLSHILNRLEYPSLAPTLRLLFSHLTRAFVKLEPNFHVNVDGNVGTLGGRPKIELRGEETSLRRAWDRAIKPNLQSEYQWILALLSERFMDAHQSLRSYGEGAEDCDHLMWLRAAVESHPQNRMSHGIDALIDFAVDTLDWMKSQRAEELRQLSDHWADSPAPMLRRLALYAQTAGDAPANDKLDWLLRRDLLFRLGMKHEVFVLLRQAFPAADEGKQAELVERVEMGPDQGHGVPHPDMDSDYEIYNVLVWLNQAAPNSEIVAESLGRMLEKRPTFRPREFPDLDIVMGGLSWAGPQSPSTVEELLGLEPAEHVQEWLEFEGDEFAGPSRSGLLAEITRAAVESPDWGLRLAQALVKKSEWDSDLWPSLFGAWRERRISDEGQFAVLSLLLSNPSAYRHCLPVSRMLGQMVTALELSAEALESLEVSERVAGGVYEACQEEPIRQVFEQAEGVWWTTATNHPGGVLAEFWLNAASARARVKGNEWHGLPAAHAEQFERILSDEGPTGAMARVVLAGHLHQLYSLDADWTVEHLVPIFDWSIDKKRAAQAWDAYLFVGRIHESLLPHFLPFYRQTLVHFQELDSHGRVRLAHHFAIIAVHCAKSPVDEPWLIDFFCAADDETRSAWAEQMAREIDELPAESAKAIWSGWLRGYWENRQNGRPRPIGPKESSQMVTWPLALTPIMGEAVEVLTRSEPVVEDAGFLLFRLADTDLPESNGAEVAVWLEYVLRGSLGHEFYSCQEAKELVERLLPTPAATSDLVSVCEALAALHCPNALELLNRVREGRG